MNMVKNKGEMDLREIALFLKVSPKTAKGYVRELVRLGYMEMDENGIVRLVVKSEDPVQKLTKLMEIHESEIAMLKKSLEEVREELMKLKRKQKER